MSAEVVSPTVLDVVAAAEVGGYRRDFQRVRCGVAAEVVGRRTLRRRWPCQPRSFPQRRRTWPQRRGSWPRLSLRCGGGCCVGRDHGAGAAPARSALAAEVVPPAVLDVVVAAKVLPDGCGGRDGRRGRRDRGCRGRGCWAGVAPESVAVSAKIIRSTVLAASAEVMPEAATSTVDVASGHGHGCGGRGSGAGVAPASVAMSAEVVPQKVAPRLELMARAVAGGGSGDLGRHLGVPLLSCRCRRQPCCSPR